jgi:hypothetical protein
MLIIEGFMQDTSDTADEKGMSYFIGTLIPDIASVVIGAKGLDKVARAGRLGKVDDVANLAGDIGRAGRTAKLLDEDLMAELAGSGVKYTADDVLMVVRDTDGRLLWLEKGGSDAGLEHIISRHADDFGRRGITKGDIPEFIRDMIANNRPFEQGVDEIGPFAKYAIDGKRYKLIFGNNGFVVNCYPAK